MLESHHGLPAHARLLIEVLVEPSKAASFNGVQWDSLLRTARSARLLGVLGSRLGIEERAPESVVPAVRRHLIAGRLEARYRWHKAVFLYESVAKVLAPLTLPLVLLKGAGYIAQGLNLANGRLLADVDLMVPKQALSEVERLLAGAGWQFEKTDPYDQHYYRAWSHELPPMQCAGQALQLDVHHTILPPIGQLKPDTQALFDASIPLGDSGFRVLCPADQLLHAAAHLFQDSDCVGRLRDLVDIDGLVREFSERDSGFWKGLYERARLHHLGRPLWYSLTLSRHWLDTPIPEGSAEKIFTEFRPPTLQRWLVLGLASRTMPPVDPDGEPSVLDRLAGTLLEWRAVWLRMPAWTLAYHSSHKAHRSIAEWWRRIRSPAAI